jgi:hypothetical protein
MCEKAVGTKQKKWNTRDIKVEDECKNGVSVVRHRFGLPAIFAGCARACAGAVCNPVGVDDYWPEETG